MESRKEKANALHDKGYNCAQAVACTFADKVDVDEEVLFRACEGLGLGMGCMQGTCGAISGACVLAGFVNSSTNLDAPNSKQATYRLSRQIVEKFQARNQGTICKDLKGVETGKMLRACPDCIMDAVEFVEEVLFSE